MSFGKKLAFSFIALVVIPLLFFIMIEVSLRLAGVGTHYSYFNEIAINGEEYFQDNKSFANQFYPPSLGIAPLNNTLKAENDDDIIRVYVLGGSAAQGFPHVNHGLDRHLNAQLRAALPGKTIEVINTAMTSVNSHVVYEVARTLPDESADYAIILMGNNEVVGPYGPSTFNQNFLSSLTMIRALQALKRTRTWQALSSVIQQAKPAAEKDDIVWQGMQMFTEFSVPHNDPRLDDVYSHYEDNLSDIIEILQAKGMHVIVSSVPVNIRHSAPFASAHKTNLSENALAEWQTLYEAAEQQIKEGNWSAAVSSYRALLAIDDEHADTHFRLATALEKMRRFDNAKTHFEYALDYDTQRFRTNTVINGIINNVVNEQADNGALTYVDNVTAFANASKPYTPGWNLLHEHVHFDFSGNYVLAREFTKAIMAQEGTTNYRRLSSKETAEWIGFPNHETNQVMTRLVGMVQKAPFSNQSNFNELLDTTKQRQSAIVSQVGSPGDVINRRQALVDSGHADWKIHFELAELNKFLRDQNKIKFHLDELFKLYPHNHESHLKKAESLSREGSYRDAIYYLEQSLNYTRGDDTKVTQAIGWLGLSYMRINEYDKGIEYLETIIDDYSDQVGATLRAYGTLVKYAKENNKANDLKRYVDGVQNYADLKISEGKDKEFGLLYRRMSQILTLAGDPINAKKWLDRQPRPEQ